MALVVVYELDVFRSCNRPLKAQPKLVVHADRVLADAIARQRFEVIGRREPQIFKADRLIKHVELSPCHPDQIGRKPPAGPA